MLLDPEGVSVPNADVEKFIRRIHSYAHEGADPKFLLGQIRAHCENALEPVNDYRKMLETSNREAEKEKTDARRPENRRDGIRILRPAEPAQ